MTETTKQTADNLLRELNDMEQVLGAFRNASNPAFPKMIKMPAEKLNEKMDADTQNIIKRDAEYELMYRFLENNNLLEQYGKYRSEIYKEVNNVKH